MANELKPETVSVIGLGAMGTALAKAFLANNHRVTVWNRTAAKCTPLADAGARVARSVAEAADESDVIVVCVLDYAASNSLLHTPDVAGRLSGKTVVQLTTGRPQETREQEAWAKQHGVAYVDGAIMGYPKDMGTPDGTVLYAGSHAVFEAVLPVLLSLGQHALFVGENIATAAALDASLIGSYSFGAALAFLYGAAICDAEGVPLDTYLSMVVDLINPGFVVPTVQTCVEMIRKGSYAGADATLDVWAAGVRKMVQITRDNGVDSAYIEGLLGYLERAIAMGHGRDEFPAVFECFRKRTV